MKSIAKIAGTCIIAVLFLVGCTPEEASLLDDTNASRAAYGVPALSWNEANYQTVEQHVFNMGAVGYIYHSDLSRIRCYCSIVGENVAVGGSIESIYAALMNSPPHRANILDWRYTNVTIVARYINGLWWVAQVFYG